MARRAQYEVDLVVLGDASVGKTALINKFINAEEAEGGPTVGVEGKSLQVALGDGTAVDVMLWDFAGQERYTKLNGDALRGADGCVLVFDLLSRDSYHHVGLWHDEFLQNSIGCTVHLSPPFLLLGNKSDELKEPKSKDSEGSDDPDTPTPSATTEEVLGWCASEHIDINLWGAGSAVTKTPIPYYEVSAVTGKHVKEAFVEIVERSVYRQQRLKEILGNEERYGLTPSPSTTPTPTDVDPTDVTVTDVVDIKVALMGDTATGKTVFLSQCKHGGFEERYEPTQQPAVTQTLRKLDDKQVRFEIWDIPGKDRLGPLTCIKRCHVCVIAVAANSLKSLERARLWQEVFIRETGIRCHESVHFILLHTKADFDDLLADVPSSKARTWATSNNFHFISCNATEHAKAADAMDQIARTSLDRRFECIYERIQAQLESAEMGRASQERMNKNKLERERMLLFSKHPTQPVQGYIDGKVWTGTREGKDTFIDAPVYSFPVKNLKGEVIDADAALNQAQHLPLLIEKLSDLRNDMTKIEQQHKDELENLRSANLLEVSSIRRDLEETRALLEEEKQKHDELRWELRLVWQTLESK